MKPQFGQALVRIGKYFDLTTWRGRIRLLLFVWIAWSGSRLYSIRIAEMISGRHDLMPVGLKGYVIYAIANLLALLLLCPIAIPSFYVLWKLATKHSKST